MGTRVAASHFSDKNLTGVSQLLEDLQRLAEDHESADIVFLLGREEIPVYAHRIMLMARPTNDACGCGIGERLEKALIQKGVNKRLKHKGSRLSQKLQLY